MGGFVIRIALRQQVPSHPGVQNPECGFQHRLGEMGLRPGLVRGVLLEEMVPNPVPLIVAQNEHTRSL